MNGKWKPLTRTLKSEAVNGKICVALLKAYGYKRGILGFVNTKEENI